MKKLLLILALFCASNIAHAQFQATLLQFDWTTVEAIKLNGNSFTVASAKVDSTTTLFTYDKSGNQTSATTYRWVTLILKGGSIITVRCNPAGEVRFSRHGKKAITATFQPLNSGWNYSGKACIKVN